MVGSEIFCRPANQSERGAEFMRDICEKVDTVFRRAFFLINALLGKQIFLLYKFEAKIASVNGLSR